MRRVGLALVLGLSVVPGAWAQRLTVNFGAVPQPVYFATVPHVVVDSGASGTFFSTTATVPASVRLSNGLGFLTPTTPNDTQPVSASALPLPAGAAKESGNLATIATALQNLPATERSAWCGGWPCRSLGPSGYTGTNALAVAYDPLAPPIPAAVQRGNAPLLWQSDVAGLTVASRSGVLNALGVSVQGTIATGTSGCGVVILAGTLAATVTFEQSGDGTIWGNATTVAHSTLAQIFIATFTNPNATSYYSPLIGNGVLYVRVRVSAYTSGSATAVVNCTPVVSSFALSLSAGVPGQAAPAIRTIIGGADPGGLAQSVATTTTYPVGTEQGLLVRNANTDQASLITFQASQVSGILAATTTRTTTTGLDRCRMLDILINITGGGVATGTLQLYLQDSADGGTTWDDLVSSNTFTFGAAVVTQRFWVLSQSAITANFGTVNTVTVTGINQGSVQAVETLAAGTASLRPFGDRIRVREKVSAPAGTPTGVTYTITGVCK